MIRLPSTSLSMRRGHGVRVMAARFLVVSKIAISQAIIFTIRDEESLCLWKFCSGEVKIQSFEDQVSPK